MTGQFAALLKGAGVDVDDTVESSTMVADFIEKKWRQKSLLQPVQNGRY
jgi:hypothetical protein